MSYEFASWAGRCWDGSEWEVASRNEQVDFLDLDLFLDLLTVMVLDAFFFYWEFDKFFIIANIYIMIYIL